MCGIFGVIGKADLEVAHRVARGMYHRGPDDSGTWIDTTHTALIWKNWAIHFCRTVILK